MGQASLQMDLGMVPLVLLGQASMLRLRTSLWMIVERRRRRRKESVNREIETGERRLGRETKRDA